MNKSDFELLFRKEFKGLVVFAVGYIKDTDVAKDLVHDVFTILWEKREQIDLTGNVRSWLSTSVRNRCINFIRDNKKFDHSILSTEDHLFEKVYQPDKLEEEETILRVNEAIAALPEKCREVFLLNRFENKKYKEVAENLGISVKTVEAHMSKALCFLRKQLKTEELIYNFKKKDSLK